MTDGLIRYDFDIAGAAGPDELLRILFDVLSLDFIADADSESPGGSWHAEGSGGWSFRLNELAAGGGVRAYSLRVDVDPSDRLYANTCKWFMHPSKFPDFLRRELAQDGLEVTQPRRE